MPQIDLEPSCFVLSFDRGMIKNVKRRQKTSEKTSETLIICEAVIN